MIAATNPAPSVDPWQSTSQASASSRSILDGACALLEVLVQTQSTTQAGAKTEIELGAQKLEELKKQLADAAQQAKEASEHSGFFGFLGDVFGGDIAQIAGAVAAVAATIATAGAGAPLLLVVLSAALQAGAKLGAELGLDPKICTVLSLASAAVGVFSGTGSAQATSELADIARGVQVTGKVVQGGATMTGGVLHGVSGYYQGKQLDYQADAAGYQAANDASELDLSDAFALLERALRAAEHETNTASEVVQNDAASNEALNARISA